MIIVENRASVVLYNFLKSNNFKNPFILPANVCPIVPSVFLKAEVPFEFFDINESFSINREDVLNSLEKKSYSGLLFVHSYGRNFEIESFFKEIKEKYNNVCIIDDRCLCKPDNLVTYKYGDLTLFSTGYSKYVDIGFGGWGIVNKMFEYNQQKLEFCEADYISLLKAHKNSITNFEKFILPNSLNWLDTSTTFFDNEKYFDKVFQIRKKMDVHKNNINKIYNNELPEYIQMAKEYNGWRFNILVDGRDVLIDEIFKNGLFVGTNYPSISEIFSNKKCPIAEMMSSRIINLFNDFRIKEKDAFKLTKIINSNLSFNTNV